MALKFVCIVSSTREGRMADRVIKLIKSQFQVVMAPKGHSIQIIDPEVYDLPMLKKPLHFYRDRSDAPDVLIKLNEIVQEADAFLICTAEYNATLPPALTNLIDHLPPASFEYKPSGIIGYSLGSRGGAFATTAARPFLAETGCLPVKHATTIASLSQEINENGETENTHIVSSLGKLFSQVEWWAEATKAKRDADGLPK